MGRKLKITEMCGELKQFIAECVARRNTLELTSEEVGYRTGLGSGWIRRFERGEELNPTVESLRKVAKALDLNFCLAVCPIAGSYDDQARGVYTKRVLSQLVPSNV